MEAEEAPVYIELVQTATFVQMKVFLFRQTADKKNVADSHLGETTPKGGKSSVQQWSKPERLKALEYVSEDHWRTFLREQSMAEVETAL